MKCHFKNQVVDVTSLVKAVSEHPVDSNTVWILLCVFRIYESES